jgi:hypothetical protein
MRTNILVAITALVIGCHEGARTQPQATTIGQGKGISLTEIPGRAYSYKRHSLCEALPRFRAGAGAYQVESLTSFMETPPEGGKPVPYTYAQLRLKEGFTRGAVEAPVVRLHGGATPDGITVPIGVELAVGETLVVLLQEKTAYNKGYYAMDALGVFRADENGQYTNRMHAIGNSRASARGTLQHTYGKSLAECKQSDVVPEAPRLAPVREPDVEYAGEQRLEMLPE